MSQKVLTKFTRYWPELFSCKGDAGIKISFPSEFNDLFDAQIRLPDSDIEEIEFEFNKMNIPTTKDGVKYYIERLQTINLLSFIGKSAIDFDTSHMWGIYANNGKGIALEFDYIEVENRFCLTLLKCFLSELYQAKNKHLFIKTKLNKEILNYIKEFLRNYKDINKTSKEESLDLDKLILLLTAEVTTILSNTTLIEDLIYILHKPIFGSALELLDNLVPITYNSRFDTSCNIFKFYLYSMLTKTFSNKIGYNNIDLFFSNKNSIWQNENEYRIITSNYILPIIEEVEQKNNFSGKANFKQAIIDLIKKRKLLIKAKPALTYSSTFILDHYKSKQGLMPFSKTLPYPTKIYLGWAFKKFKNINKLIESNELTAIKLFCSHIENIYHHNIEIYQLSKTVNYKRNMFEYEPIEI